MGSELKYCPNCGKELLVSEAKFCPYCGYAIEIKKAEVVIQQKVKEVRKDLTISRSISAIILNIVSLLTILLSLFLAWFQVSTNAGPNLTLLQLFQTNFPEDLFPARFFSFMNLVNVSIVKSLWGLTLTFYVISVIISLLAFKYAKGLLYAGVTSILTSVFWIGATEEFKLSLANSLGQLLPVQVSSLISEGIGVYAMILAGLISIFGHLIATKRF